MLQTIKNIESQLLSGISDIDFQVPPTLKDLNFALTTKLRDSDRNIHIDISPIIGGEFRQEAIGDVKFYRNDTPIELTNTAMGIRYFGILQMLMKNNHLYNGQILILDEPEVHLHPKWQLELAKIIVYLVKNGVKILVNSHSPYMIEAIQRYGKKRNANVDFYLAEDGTISKTEDTLSKIFEKLSEPFDEFDKMDREVLNG